MELKRLFESQIDEHKYFIKEIVKEHSAQILGEVTVGHLFRGMRGVPACYTPTSHVEPDKGVLYRGVPLRGVLKQLPVLDNATIPSAEAVFWFLLTGIIPSKAQVETLQKDLNARSFVPHHVYNTIDSLPKKSRPMTRLSIGIMAWTTSSSFQDMYDKGILSKSEHWSHAFDDALNLIAGVNKLTAYIYRIHCQGKNALDPDPRLDWVANLAYMMGYTSPDIQDLLRMYVLVHADHGASNVSAHTAHTVGSALANAFYTSAASMLGLAGPLHGHANEQSILWLLTMMKKAQKVGLGEPNDAFITKYVQNTINEGRVIPGYGHAALRIEDPRFTLFYDFEKTRDVDSPLLRVVDRAYRIIPEMLKNIEKISNPYPNMDAITGACLYSRGIVEHNFYTVLFGTSRLLGILAQHIIDRSIGQPIFRPKTVSTHLFTHGVIKK